MHDARRDDPDERQTLAHLFAPSRAVVAMDHLARSLRARQRVLAAFNKRQSDFASLREWNDYLERVETLIFNLTEGVDVNATEAAIAEHKRAHASEIAHFAARAREEAAAAAAAGEDAGMEDAGARDGGYAPEAAGAAATVAPVPVPTSAVRRGLENTSLGFDENTEEGKRARAEAIARACGFDGKVVAKERCLREAFATIWV